MTQRRARALGLAIVAAGALLGGSAVLWADRPEAMWRPLLIGLVAYASTGALVLHCGLEVYGPRGAIAATALTAFTPNLLAALAAPPLLAAAGATTLVGCFAQLATLYALMKCLLDPVLSWATLAGIALVAAPIIAFVHGAQSTVVVGMAALSVFLIADRVATAERSESRPRVAHASMAAVALAWSVALAIIAVAVVLSALPADAATAPSAVGSWAGLATLPLAALLLTALRPWRPQRRFTDAGWIAALLCLAAPLWFAWGEPGGVVAAPFAALLAGACWDADRAVWMRRAAGLVVAAQIVAAVVLWPRYPGGVRADAWLSTPGISLDRMDAP